MTREKNIAKRLIWFCFCCSCSFKHLSGMRKILKIRDTVHINVFKKFVSFLILSTPTDTLGILQESNILNCSHQLSLKRNTAQRLGHMKLQLHSSYIGK